MALTEGANIQRIAERITEQLVGVDSSETDTSKVDENKEGISVAASRHGHAEQMTEKETAELSKKLLEDAMKTDPKTTDINKK